MNAAEILKIRLINQQIAFSSCATPQEVVTTLVAMQAQEYAQAKWAIGLRMKKATDTLVEQAFNDGKILRTHVLRPTWHFVAPADIRWLLTLTAPRVHAVNAFMARKCAVDEKLMTRCKRIIARELEGGRSATRNELNEALAKNKIIAEGIRLSLIFMWAELDQLICSGPRQGKQFTYALLEERVPKSVSITRKEGLVLLIDRYFSSRGPATLKDFATWSGLSLTEAKQGIAEIQECFESFDLNGLTYYHKLLPAQKRIVQSTFLMPDYDEYVMSYKYRDLVKVRMKNLLCLMDLVICLL